MRTTLCLALAIVIGFGTSGCVNREQQKQAKRTEEILADTSKPVVLAEVRTADLKSVLNITGTITTSEDVQVGAKNPGRLVSVNVRDGDPVRAGQVIATQETTDVVSRLRQANAQMTSAQSGVSQALANFRQGPVKSLAAVRGAEAQLASARAQYAKAKAGPRDEERKQSESRVASAKSNMDTAKADLDRKRKLFEEGAISRQALDTAENAYINALSLYQDALEQNSMMQNWTRPEDLEIAREAVRAAEQNVAQAKAQQRLDVVYKDQLDAARSNLKSAIAAQDLAQNALSDAQIRAPFSGQIYGNPVQVGTFLSAGTTIVRIVGKGGVYFEGQIPESSVDAISIGRSVAVTVAAVPGRAFSGRVVTVSPFGDNIGRQFTARIQLLGHPHAIKPGMFAEGAVSLETYPGVMVVPFDVIVKSRDGSAVFTVTGNKAKRVKVTTGIREGGLIEVRGLMVGDKVVLKGQGQLVDGSVVTIDPNQAAKDDSAAAGS